VDADHRELCVDADHKWKLEAGSGSSDGKGDHSGDVPGAQIGAYLPDRTICGQLNTTFSVRDLSGRPTCTRNLCPSLAAA
jgi:hypothetical protein